MLRGEKRPTGQQCDVAWSRCTLAALDKESETMLQTLAYGHKLNGVQSCLKASRQVHMDYTHLCDLQD